MGISIFRFYKDFQFTFADYRIQYDQSLKEFLSAYEDNSEEFFVEEQLLNVEYASKYLLEYFEKFPNDHPQIEDVSELRSNRINTHARIIAFLNQRKQELERERKTNQHPSEPDVVKSNFIAKPCFNSESINIILKLLKCYFDTKDHAELKRIIETGDNAVEKLLFKDNGNKLSDYFKKLFESNTITCCSKTDLINWIIENFEFIHNKNRKEFTFKTVEKTISGNGHPCKNPII